MTIRTPEGHQGIVYGGREITRREAEDRLINLKVSERLSREREAIHDSVLDLSNRDLADQLAEMSPDRTVRPGAILHRDVSEKTVTAVIARIGALPNGDRQMLFEGFRDVITLTFEDGAGAPEAVLAQPGDEVRLTLARRFGQIVATGFENRSLNAVLGT